MSDFSCTYNAGSSPCYQGSYQQLLACSAYRCLNHAMSNKQLDFQPVERINDAIFDAEIDKLIAYSEDLRIGLMCQHRTRRNLATTIFIILVLIGSMGFGWFLFFEGRVDIAVMCVMLAIGLSFMAHLWSEKPLQQYKIDYKRKFMPRLAKLLGGLKFYSARGIGRKILSRTGVIPKHETYVAEDCFMGDYKGVKVIFSEARLYPGKRQADPVFNGIFVLMEAPQRVFDAHTIVTSDHAMAQRYANKRWKKLSPVSMPNVPEEAAHFRAYSSNPASAELILGEKLLTELSEAASVFDQAQLTTVLFGKKFIFMMIPYAHDMFEASDVHIPVKTRLHAQQSRDEINKKSKLRNRSTLKSELLA